MCGSLLNSQRLLTVRAVVKFSFLRITSMCMHVCVRVYSQKILQNMLV